MAYSENSNTVTNNGIKDSNFLKKSTELDFIPTKITAIEPDPSLFITPEKKGLLKSATKKVNNLKNTSSVAPDPDLFVTPEKISSVLKSFAKQSNNPPVTKNKVRFNIPDSCEENLTESFSPNSQSGYNESSTLSTEFEDGSSQTTDDVSDFAVKAALYTQRNPLGDITLDSHLNFDSTTSSGTLSSMSISSQKSFSKIFDMKGKRITQKSSTGNVIEPSKADSTIKITTSKRSLGHRKNNPVQKKIDRLTSDHTLSKDQVPEQNSSKKHSTYLKKKSGLHKHQHSVHYLDKEKDSTNTSNFENPKYNSSLAIGQKCQQIKEEKFDAMKILSKKVDTDSDLKMLIDTKAASATNLDPEEVIFSNLVSVDVAPHDVITAPEFRRLKRPQIVKSSPIEEPEIMEAFPGDLIYERSVLDSRSYVLPDINLVQVSLSSVMSLYEHSLSWT